MRIRNIFRRWQQTSQPIAEHGQHDREMHCSIGELFDALARQAVERGADQSKIAVALDRATQAAAEELAKRLRANAPNMLRDHARFRKDFEQRLYLRWGPALDLFEAVRTCCLEAGEGFYMQHRPATDAKLSALTLLHARACLVASEVHGLLRTGHAAGAQARWRTLHELAVIAFLLGSHDTDIAERFLGHRAIERYKDALQYQEHCEVLGYERFSQDKIDSMRSEYDELVVRYGESYKKPWGWAKPLLPSQQTPDFAKLEKLAGLEHFRSWYRLASHTIHSGATGAMHIKGFYGHGDVMLAGPSNAGLADPGSGTLISLYQVTTALIVNSTPGRTEPLDLIQLRAISVLLDEAQAAFLAVHHQLRTEQAEIDAKNLI